MANRENYPEEPKNHHSRVVSQGFAIKRGWRIPRAPRPCFLISERMPFRGSPNINSIKSKCPMIQFLIVELGQSKCRGISNHMMGIIAIFDPLLSFGRFKALQGWGRFHNCGQSCIFIKKIWWEIWCGDRALSKLWSISVNFSLSDLETVWGFRLSRMNWFTNNRKHSAVQLNDFSRRITLRQGIVECQTAISIISSSRSRFSVP
jgi:hypothetical protein